MCEFNQTMKEKRTNTLIECYEKISGGKKNSKSYKQLMKFFLLHHIKTLQELCEEEPRLCIELKKLTPKETLDFLRALGLRVRDHKRIITMTNKLQKNFLSSLDAVQKEKKGFFKILRLT